MNNKPKEIIENFNNNNSIKDVIETVTGTTIRGKSFCCPIHGGDNKHGASINEGKNMFSCWTGDCGKGITPWYFVAKYYNLDNFKDIAKKINKLFKANIPIYEKGEKVQKDYKFHKPKIKFDESLILNKKYIGEDEEVRNRILEVLKEFKGVVLQANTGMGKNYFITNLSKDLDVDYTFILAPTRSIVEDVESNYPHFKKFYGNDTELPTSKYIIATYNKARAINKQIETITEYNALLGKEPPRIAIIIDETHELLLKRNLLGTCIIKELECLIKNADYKLFMSANTNNFIKAYKDDDIYNITVNIEHKAINYNANNLYIYRCNSKPKVRLQQIYNKIIDNLGYYEHIFTSIDSKKDLKILSDILTKDGIDNVIINSENKDEKEILQDYLSIVNNNKLNKTVVLCTSIINAGNSILNENVLTINYQSKIQFNLDKIEQLMGRVRTDKNNDIMLFLDYGEPLKYTVYSMDRFLERNTMQCKLLADDFNYYWFNKTGEEDKTEDLEIEFNLYKENDKYRYFKNCFYVENNILKIDNKAIYQLSNLEWQKFNYFNDEFIIEMLKDVKVREIHKVITLVSTEKLEDVETLEIKELRPLADYLNEIKSNNKALSELYKYFTGDIRSKDFKEDINIQLYEEHKGNSLYREFISNSKTIIKALKSYNLHSLQIEIFSDMLDIYTMTNEKNKLLGKKARDKLLSQLKRIKIYNKAFPLGTHIDDIKAIGDIDYCNIRYLDKICKNRTSPRKRQLETILANILKDKGSILIPQDRNFQEYNKLLNKKYLTKEEKEILKEIDRNILTNKIKGEWYDKRGKKIDFQRELEVMEQSIREIYNCSKTLKLYTLN